MTEYLVSFQKRLCSSHIFSQLLRGHQPSYAVNPGHQISEKVNLTLNKNTRLTVTKKVRDILVFMCLFIT